MSEIEKPIIEDYDGNFVITPNHTIADIARLIVAEKWEEDLIYCIEKTLEENEVCK